MFGTTTTTTATIRAGCQFLRRTVETYQWVPCIAFPFTIDKKTHVGLHIIGIAGPEEEFR